MWSKNKNPLQNIALITCEDEYDCRCGIMRMLINGKWCQICGCSKKFAMYEKYLKMAKGPTNRRPDDAIPTTAASQPLPDTTTNPILDNSMNAVLFK